MPQEKRQHFDDPLQNRIFSLVHQGLFITIGLNIVLFVVVLLVSGSVTPSVLFIVAAIVPQVIGLLTLRRGWLHQTTIFLSSYFIILMIVGAFLIGFIPTVVFGVYILAIAFVGVSVGRLAMQIFAVFSFAVWSALNLLDYVSRLTHLPAGSTEFLFAQLFAFAIVVLILYTLIDALNHSLAQSSAQQKHLSRMVNQLQESTLSENFLNDIFESLSDMLIVLDKDMYISRVNRLVVETTGYQESELIGKHIDILFPDKRIMLRPIGANEMTETRELVLNLDTECLTKDGRHIPVSFKYSPIYDDQNQFKGIICTAQNLTEIRFVRRELEISNRRYLLALGASQGGVVEWNFIDSELYVDPNLKHYLGYSERTLPSTVEAIRELIEPDDLNTIRKLINRVDTGKTAFEHEFRMRHRDGNLVWFLARGRLIFNSEGKLESLIAALINITLRRSIEQELRDSKDRLHDLLETLPDLILRVDPKGLILEFISPTSFPLPDDENYVNRRIYDILPFDIASHLMDYVRQTIDGNKPEFYEYQLDENGQINTYEARFTDFGHDEVIIIVRQVNARKRVEEERVQVQVKAERTRLLSDFVQSTSHDFRTTLNVVTNGLFYLKRVAENGDLDTDKALERLPLMEEQAHRLARLLESLFIMLRLDTTDHLDFRMARINELVQEVVERNQLLAKRHEVTLHAQYPETDPRVPVDDLEFGQALMNLVNNAIIYNVPGGQVNISVEDTRDRLIIRIQDSGDGIPEEHMKSIFEQLFKVDSNRQLGSGGLGLGLPIAMRIVQLHHGTLDVESEVGKGSTFTITLFKNYLIAEPHHA